jgi:hypothetical protein
MLTHGQAEEARLGAAHKTATYRSCRFLNLAALVPSAGTLKTLKTVKASAIGVLGTSIALKAWRRCLGFVSKQWTPRAKRCLPSWSKELEAKAK